MLAGRRPADDHVGHLRRRPPRRNGRGRRRGAAGRARGVTKLVMSTTLLIGRNPTARSRWRSHPGDGPTAMPSITRAAKRGQPAGSSIRTGRATRPRSPRAARRAPTAGGSLRPSPSAAASSRAIPMWQRQSGRLVVTSSSRTVSRVSTSPSACPGVPSSRMRMPSASSPTPSSIAEQSMPGDLCPRMVFTPRRSSMAGRARPGRRVGNEVAGLDVRAPRS